MFFLSKLKDSVMRKSRSDKLDHFYHLCGDECSILDVGVSNNEHSKQVNLFLNSFRYNDKYYTGLAVQPMSEIAKKHPNKRFVEYPGGLFPFADNEFDWVFSNAVVEHVGDRDAQLQFINEMLRVGKKVFLPHQISTSQWKVTQMQYLYIGILDTFINGANNTAHLGTNVIYYC